MERAEIQDLDESAVAGFLTSALSTSDPINGDLEIEAAFSVIPGCEIEHNVVEYALFYRCFAGLTARKDVVRVSSLVHTIDRCYSGTTRSRTDLASGQITLISKQRLLAPSYIKLTGFWPHAHLKFRAAVEKKLPSDHPIGALSLERQKERRSVHLASAPLWRIDFTRVSDSAKSFHQHEIEIELLSPACAISTAVSQFRHVVDILALCMSPEPSPSSILSVPPETH